MIDNDIERLRDLETFFTSEELARRLSFKHYQLWLTGVRDDFVKQLPIEQQHRYNLFQYLARRDAENEPKSQNKDNSIIFITISPEHSVTLDEFKETVERFTKRTVFDKSELQYTFEQTGETPESMGYHMHCHILCNKKVNTSPQKYHDMLKQTFKHIKHISDIKKYPASYFTEKSDYLQGKKWDKNKEKAVEINKLWRERHNLLPIYK